GAARNNRPLTELFRQRFAFCFRGKPDENQTQQINQRDDRARLGVTVVVVRHQSALRQRPDRRQNSTEVETQTLASRPDPGRKQLRQVQRQPAVESGRDTADNPNKDQKRRAVLMNRSKQQAAKDQRQQAQAKIGRPTPNPAAEPRSDKAANDRA